MRIKIFTKIKAVSLCDDSWKCSSKICFEKQDRRCSICLVQRTSSTKPCSTPLWWWWNYCIKKRHWLVISRLCKWIFFVPALCQNLQSLVICRAPRFSFVAHKIERVLLGQANVHLTNECVYINIPKTRNNWSLIESKDIRDFIFGVHSESNYLLWISYKGHFKCFNVGFFICLNYKLHAIIVILFDLIMWMLL